MIINPPKFRYAIWKDRPWSPNRASHWRVGRKDTSDNNATWNYLLSFGTWEGAMHYVNRCLRQDKVMFG